MGATIDTKVDPRLSDTPDGGEWRLTQTWLNRKPAGGAKQIVTISLALVCLINYTHFQGLWPIRDLFAASWQNVSSGQWYRLWTTVLVHADLGHVLANAFFLIIFGYLLAGYFGPWVFPILVFALSGIVSLLSLITYPPTVMLIGASGMVNVMGGIWLSLYFALARNHKPFARFLRTGGVLLVLFLPHEYHQHVSDRTHLIGLGVGLLSGFAWFLLHKGKFRSAEKWVYIPLPVESEEDIPF